MNANQIANLRGYHTGLNGDHYPDMRSETEAYRLAFGIGFVCGVTLYCDLEEM